MERALRCALALLALLGAVSCGQGPRQPQVGTPNHSAEAESHNPAEAGSHEVTASANAEQDDQQFAPIPSQAAVEVVDLARGEVVLLQRGDVLDRVMWPASVAKVFTLRAALDAGLVDAQTRVPCPGRLTIGRRTLQCVHPRFTRPLSADEALAHSCNAFFTSVARRVPVETWSSALTAVGLPSMPERVGDIRLASVGLDGPRASPRRLRQAFAATVRAALARGSAADRVLLAGLREAARAGTAAAFRDAGIEALAKTGTAPFSGGAFTGLVVAVTPPDSPRYAVVALGAGASGRDAAGIAATALRQVLRASGDARHVPTETPAHIDQPPGRAAGADLELMVGVAHGGSYRTTSLTLEDYVAGVVEGEADPVASGAVREALAIAARSYAVALAPRHAAEGFDLCDLTHCQVYRRPSPSSRAAASATRGLVLQYDDAIVPAYHAASCGGRLESPAAVWPDEGPSADVMPAREDPAGASHDDAWRAELSAAQILTALRALGARGDELRALNVTGRSRSGRVVALRAEGLVPAETNGEAFRLAVGRSLGWQHLKSSLYDVTRTGTGYRFSGRGRGHGVGLCVAGATALARGGKGSREIVAAYFPGAAIVTRPPEATSFRLRLELPSADEPDRARLSAAIARHAEAVGRRAGRGWPGAVLVRFHDSVESYQRATGQPWWTAGATRAAHVDLLPVAVLRRRNLLDRTVRHELAHVLSEPVLGDAPRWVKEGVARHLAGEDAAAPPPASCPPDALFRAATSAAAMETLYDASLACVVREMREKGGDWRALRTPAASGVRTDATRPAPR